LLFNIKNKFSNINIPSYQNLYRKIQNDKFFYLIIFPSNIGGIIGGGIGFYEGYISTKNDSFGKNVICSYGASVIGYCTGIIGGALWPISITVFLLIQIE